MHTFHIPVMGTGFTVDTPVKVAPFGISSVVSLGDDKLLEKLRRFYAGRWGEEYVPIPETDRDHRARRITAYLDLIDRLVERQMRDMREMPFEEGNALTRFFELLDEKTSLKQTYIRMLAMPDGKEKRFIQDWLRNRMEPGSIDVNIMTKADRPNTFHGEKLPAEYSDAMAALRGFAQSRLRSSVVFSAGLNLHLFSYAAEFEDFFPDGQGNFRKKITIKVSDVRSAFVQARVLAKKGLWVSEYRLESGLNCGGHAFPTTGQLMGPILEEFKARRVELISSLYETYRDALLAAGRVAPDRPPLVRVSAQGGVGTSAEHRFLLRYYSVDSVGWGSPFLLVPEATAVDDETLESLRQAGEDDIFLSQASPLGVPFYNLRTSASERTRRERIAASTPGSPCLSRFLAFNTEYGSPLCVASRAYQSRKLKDLGEDQVQERESVLAKSCICRDLGDGVLLKYGIEDEKKLLTPAVCPGPNLAYFSKICSLREMVDHIYGRCNVLNPLAQRSHFLLNELKLYIKHLRDLAAKSCDPSKKDAEYFLEFKHNLSEGIEYYKRIAQRIHEETKTSRERFLAELAVLARELEGLMLVPQPV